MCRAGLQALNAGIPQGLARLRAAPDGDRDAWWRRGKIKPGRLLSDPARPDRRSRPRCHPLFPAARKADSQLTFDIDLARSQSSDNPVYYIQYAHARVCSIFPQLAEAGQSWNAETGLAALSALTLDSEKDLIVKLGRPSRKW